MKNDNTQYAGATVFFFRLGAIRAYYNEDAGIGFTMGRVPIGGSDFSERPYTYDDLEDGEVDPNLASFSLQPEDENLKVTWDPHMVGKYKLPPPPPPLLNKGSGSGETSYNV
jgi:hypothetical protein